MIPENYEKIHQIARVCHEANRAYCVSIGDTSQVSWDEAPDWQKKSAINGVIFHLINPKSVPEDSHVNWLKEKLADGWKYGVIKDVEKKEHPCCVEYENLPKSQKLKDELYTSIIKAFLNQDM